MKTNIEIISAHLSLNMYLTIGMKYRYGRYLATSTKLV